MKYDRHGNPKPQPFMVSTLVIHDLTPPGLALGRYPYAVIHFPRPEGIDDQAAKLYQELREAGRSHEIALVVAQAAVIERS